MTILGTSASVARGVLLGRKDLLRHALQQVELVLKALLFNDRLFVDLLINQLAIATVTQSDHCGPFGTAYRSLTRF